MFGIFICQRPSPLPVEGVEKAGFSMLSPKAVAQGRANKLHDKARAALKRKQRRSAWLKDNGPELLFGGLVLGGLTLLGLSLASGFMSSGKLAIPKHAFHGVARWSSEKVLSLGALGCITAFGSAMIYNYLGGWNRHKLK